MSEFNISVASYSFNRMIREGELNVFGYFDLLKYRYHVDYADIWTEGCFKSLDHDYIRSIRAAMDRNGLKLANLCVDGPYVWCDNPEERAAHKAQMLEYLEAARILGAKTVRIDFGFAGGGMMEAFRIMRDATREQIYSMSDEAFEYIVKTYREYCEIVSEWGCRIGPENHWGWDRIPAYLKKVADAVDHPAYGHLYHLRNFYDNPEEGEQWCIEHAMHTHVHANSIPYAKDVLRRLALAGYQGTYGIEHHSGKYETERVDWQLGSLRAMLAEIKDCDLSAPAESDYMSRIYSDDGLF